MSGLQFFLTIVRPMRGRDKVIECQSKKTFHIEFPRLTIWDKLSLFLSNSESFLQAVVGGGGVEGGVGISH